MHVNAKDKIGLIILAAGGSSRLGRPKQQLPFKTSTLLQHASHVALDSDCKPVVVVLGASAEESKKDLENVPVEIMVNDLWQEGMSSSIKVGLSRLLEISPDTDGVILMVCDQPYVTPHLIRKMIKAWLQSGKGILACTYSGTMGTPALFAKDYFQDLQSLQGPDGAKKVLLAYQSFVNLIPFPLGQVDIDTPEDYNNL